MSDAEALEANAAGLTFTVSETSVDQESNYYLTLAGSREDVDAAAGTWPREEQLVTVARK